MRDWLVGIFGEAYATAALWTIVLLAIALFLLVFLRVNRRFTSGTFISGSRSKQPRLAVTDATPVDNNRRLVLVRRDNVEHLILIGGPSDIVIESGIGRSRATLDETHPGAAEEPAAPRQVPARNVPEPRIETEQTRPPPPEAAPETPGSEQRPTPAEPAIQVANRASASPMPPPHRYSHRTRAQSQRPEPDLERSTPASTPRTAVAAASFGSLSPSASVTEKRESMPEEHPQESHASAPATEPTGPQPSQARHEPTVEFETSGPNEPTAKNESVSEHSLEDEMSRLLEELSEQKR